jgi:sigma-54 dependent transcriptional regulator, acetoin dehydrogenase operon transcriptional activator AcoR
MAASNTYVNTVLEQFLLSGKLPQNSVRTPIAESWMRCYRDGVRADPSRGSNASRRRGSILNHLRAEDFVRAGLPILEEARDALLHSETIAVLADAQGIVLKTEGDEIAMDAAADLGLTPDEDWTEPSRGTNAIGTALRTGTAVDVHGPEHYCPVARTWTCAGALVRDPIDATTVGVVSVAGLSNAYNPHFQALALSVAGRIQSELSAQELTRRQRLLGRSLSRLSKTESGGLLVFDRRGQFVTADAQGSVALSQLDLVPNTDVYTRIAGLDIVDVGVGGDPRPDLPRWLEPDWLEPVMDDGERIGTLVLIPVSLRRKAAALQGGLPRYKLRRAVEFVDANLDRVIHLKDMARVAQVSLFHFHRQFKKTTGLTPHQFITQRRIEQAKLLLAQSNLPIIDVAARVGFVDQSHFTTTFRKCTSMTPRIYRNAALS